MTGTRKTACVEIGEIPIGLSSSDQGFLDLLRRRYDGFLSSTTPEFELEFDLTAVGSASDEGARVRRRDDRYSGDNEWILERGDLQARWDSRTGQGLVRQSVNPYSLDAVLRIVHSLILAERGGFLLHAASAICDGRAYLFSGVSGAGKTTITRLAPPDITLLTDEISYLRPGAEGYRAFGTPFAGELAKAGENRSAPVGALFFLEKGPENHIDEVPPVDAVGRLMRNTLFFAEDKTLVDKLFATACDFVARVPIRRLTFYPDGRVWDEVRSFGCDRDHNFYRNSVRNSASNFPVAEHV